jgi:uncharacterized repeat protein (TIGR01451 family)
VYIDPAFDGASETVPDGVLYLVEGAGGNRDFDGDFLPPRGSGTGVDQDDSATGNATPVPGLTVAQGPADWLDTNLTNLEMKNNFPNAGTGPKITVKFKSKVFSFGQAIVNHNKITFYQVSEPLSSTSSATASMPAPYGRDSTGKALNDPIPDTVLDGTDGALLSAPAVGTPSLLDEWTVTKPDLRELLSVRLGAPKVLNPGSQLIYSIDLANHSQHALNGAQVHLRLPEGLALVDPTSQMLTVQGEDVVITVGRLDVGQTKTLTVKTQLTGDSEENLRAGVELFSSTALPVVGNSVWTRVNEGEDSGQSGHDN